MYLLRGLSSVLGIRSQILRLGLSRLVIPNLFFVCVFAPAIGKSVTSGGSERLSFQNYLLSSQDRADALLEFRYCKRNKDEQDKGPRENSQ